MPAVGEVKRQGLNLQGAGTSRRTRVSTGLGERAAWLEGEGREKSWGK